MLNGETMIMLTMMASIRPRTILCTSVTSIFLISSRKNTNALIGKNAKSNVISENVTPTSETLNETASFAK